MEAVCKVILVCAICAYVHPKNTAISDPLMPYVKIFMANNIKVVVLNNKENDLRILACTFYEDKSVFMENKTVVSSELL